MKKPTAEDTKKIAKMVGAIAVLGFSSLIAGIAETIVGNFVERKVEKFLDEHELTETEEKEES